MRRGSEREMEPRMNELMNAFETVKCTKEVNDRMRVKELKEALGRERDSLGLRQRDRWLPALLGHSSLWRLLALLFA